MLPCAVEPLKSSKRLVSTLESMGTVYESDADLIMRRKEVIETLHLEANKYAKREYGVIRQYLYTAHSC